MSKDTRFSIRIKAADIEFYEQNLPPEIESVSELFRSGAKQLVSGEDISSTGNLDLSGIHEAISESQTKVIFEVQQNRALLVSFQAALNSQKLIKADKLKKAAIDQLLENWLSDMVQLESYSNIEDLENSVIYDHLKEVALDAIQELKDRKLLSITPGGKLKWNL